MCNFVELSKKCYFCTMKCRILVVEDDASFGMMIQTWLKKNGYEAVLASRYEQAKIEITNGNFGLILTDLRLPDGDGIILMTWVREKLKSKVPIIVMTGYAEVQTAVSAMKLGAFDYLKKPINPSVLEEKIAAALASTDEEVEDCPGQQAMGEGQQPRHGATLQTCGIGGSHQVLRADPRRKWHGQGIHRPHDPRKKPVQGWPLHSCRLWKSFQRVGTQRAVWTPERLFHFGHCRQERRLRASQGRHGVSRRGGQPAIRSADAAVARLAGAEGEACGLGYRHPASTSLPSRCRRCATVWRTSTS